MAVYRDGLLVLDAAEVRISSTTPAWYLTETDQVDPAGRYRIRLSGDIVYFEDATGAAWATDVDILNLSSTGCVFNEDAADRDLRMEGDTNANMFVLDAGTDTMSLGAAVQANTRLFVSFPTLAVVANASGKYLDILPALTEAGAGTHAVMAGVNIQALSLTGAAAATTIASTLRIEGAPTGATTNYAVHIVAGTTCLGGALLLFDGSVGALLKSGAGYFMVRNSADTDYGTLITGYITCVYNLIMNSTAQSIQGTNSDNAYTMIKAQDNGADVIEIARMAGAADPYFSMGGSQQFKFTNAGLMGFYGVTPVAQQAHIIDATDLATCITRIAAINALLETFGLMATT